MSHIQIRISHDEKKLAKKVLDDLGLTFSSSIKLFFRQMVRAQGLPFNISAVEVEAEKKSELKTEQKETKEVKTEILVPIKPKFSNMIMSDFSAKKIH
jgi:addiction module RelB/DinJ family antitoxin